MDCVSDKYLRRRQFLTSVVRSSAAGLALCADSARAADGTGQLQAGEAALDTTPPLGIEMAGFHRPAGNERRIAGIRQPTAARALVLQSGNTQAAIVSLDICGVSRKLTTGVQQQVARQTGIPAENVRLCASHTHSMPSFCYFRQWGAMSPDYMASVGKKIVEAVGAAKADLAPAELYVGKSRAAGANVNRTSGKCKTDELFTKDSTDAERWLDTMVRVMHFQRAGAKQNLLWYHFSAHPVCFRDDKAGPDWPGLVDRLTREKEKMPAAYLQGHCGDVNAGDNAEDVAARVHGAIGRALDGAVRVKGNHLRLLTRQVPVPLDIELFKSWLAQYEKDPAQCSGGQWVDAGFANDWFESASKWDLNQTQLPVPVTAMQVGEMGLLFHPSELYSCYGLAIQRDSPLSETFVVGYTDACVGYFPDPNAYQRGEYAAITVPKIVDLPPFAPTVGQHFTAAAVALLNRVAS